MGQDDVFLEFGRFFLADDFGKQSAETGGDPVHHLFLVPPAFHQGPGTVDPFFVFLRKFHKGMVPDNGHEIIQIDFFTQYKGLFHTITFLPGLQ